MLIETYISPHGDHDCKKIKQSKPYLQQKRNTKLISYLLCIT